MQARQSGAAWTIVGLADRRETQGDSTMRRRAAPLFSWPLACALLAGTCGEVDVLAHGTVHYYVDSDCWQFAADDGSLDRRRPLHAHDAFQQQVHGRVIGDVFIIVGQADAAIRPDDERARHDERVLTRGGRLRREALRSLQAFVRFPNVGGEQGLEEGTASEAVGGIRFTVRVGQAGRARRTVRAERFGLFGRPLRHDRECQSARLEFGTQLTIVVDLSIESYEAMEEEMEDLRFTALALARLKTFDEKKALSHQYILEKFGK